MRLKRKKMIAITISCIIILSIAFVISERQEQDVLIDMITTFGQYCNHNARGHRFIVRNDGVLVSQYGIFRRNYCDFTGGRAMLLVLERSRIELSECDFQNLWQLASSVAENYYWDAGSIRSMRQSILVYDESVYRNSGCLSDLTYAIRRLSPLTAR